MQTPRTTLKPLVLACSLALAACSSGGGDGGGGGTTNISGLVEAPGGMVAQFETNQSVMVALTNFVFPGAHAAITGLQPVTGATVELIRIDDDGNQVGDVLASTVTSITGDYSLALPTGVSLAGNLVVRISGNGGASMSAMVVEQDVDINPISQYVLDKFVDDENLVLADLAVNEVVALTGKVEEFDLTATSDLSSMLAQLDAEVGELVDTEIAVINSTPDDGTATTASAGTWNIVELGIGMHDSEQQDYGTLTMDVYSESISIAAGASAGDINITTGSTFIDAWTNLGYDNMGGANIYHETSVGGENDSFPAQIDAGGNITLEFPFEEELQTVDTQFDLDGPDFGWRWPSTTYIVRDTGNNNVKVLVSTDAGVRYNTVDTNNDGVKDAVNPNSKSGDEVEVLMTLLLKQGSGMSAANLDGNYGIVTMSLDLTTNPSGMLNSTVGPVNFDAVDTVTVAASAFEDIGFERTSNGSFTSMNLVDSTGTDGGFSFPYTITTSGQLTLDTDNNGPSADDLEGWSNEDGSVFALLNVNTSGTDPITNVYNEMVVGVKLPTTTPSMGDAIFKLYPMVFGADVTGFTELVSLRNVSSFTFNAGATAATAEFTARGFERATDISSITALAGGADPAFDFTVDSIGADGAITMTFTDVAADETAVMKGFISADGKMMVLRYYEADDTQGEVSRAIGMVIGIRQ